MSLILEVLIRTLKPALYINSVYLYGLPARAPFVTRLRLCAEVSADCGLNDAYIDEFAELARIAGQPA
ncbi:hypothetical protein [Paraburkholderia sp. BL25I1N1]|uniref:hypothetical protein n=1 Tax=Paraburkholderia sp. BL25I1N1 TaxID=1938804 RepID=UPI0015E5B0C6|nr:hypothetical protein [Paraburkholderia sp. BL25I1N1]